MHAAIAVTLWFAAATSALGAWRSLRRGEVMPDRRALAGAVVGAIMTLWFTFAGAWMLSHP